MSLFGALNLGRASLATQQTGLQVTGNNIANIGTAGYSRQVAVLTTLPTVPTLTGQHVGTGAMVASIQRQVSAALNEGLRHATSDQAAANTLNSQLMQLQAIFGPLNSGDLSSQLTFFFNSFSTLANNPQDSGQRAVVIQTGISLSQSLQGLRSRLTTLQADVQAQIRAQAQSADSLVKQVAELNRQIALAGMPESAANALMDQRDYVLSQLSQIMDIRVVDQGGADLTVLVGSVPVVEGVVARGIDVKVGGDGELQMIFGDNGDLMNPTGGTIGGLISARDNYIKPAIKTVDSVAAGLIHAVNTIHSQGQGLAGFSSLTGTTQVKDPSAILSAAGLAFPPNNGSFNLYLTDKSTGLVTTRQINVNLSGHGAQDSLESLVASINAAGEGAVTATINAAGYLVITSNDQNVTFGFGEDTSGVLASLGINTFFMGTNASDIDVNQVLKDNADFLATGRGNLAGSNQNAQALALAGAAAVGLLGGKGISEFYTTYIGNLAAAGRTASDSAMARQAIWDTLFSQQQSISGVSMDEEAVNLLQYQRAFQGSARYITVVDEMLQTVLGLIR